jgi:hypothetical protein
MGKAMTQRGLSDKFMQDLKQGILFPFLDRVQQDTTLDLEIRNDYLNIYYRGGSMFRISPATRFDGYEVAFDTNYTSSSTKALLKLPKNAIACSDDAKEWVAHIPQLKDTMDLWFGKHPKDERALQQLVAWENNTSPWANGTDYFVIDIEYDNHKGARFDLVALRWDSTASARKLAKDYAPRLVIIEMKAGDGATDGDSGILGHIGKTQNFLKSDDQVACFKTEMLRVFSQKRDLGLIKTLRKNPYEVTAVANKIDFMFLFVGHDPSSQKMFRSLNVIEDTCCNTQVCVANFMGFGLYGEGVYSLEDFKTRMS